MSQQSTLEETFLHQDFDKLDKDKVGKISVDVFQQYAFNSDDLRVFRKSTVDNYLTDLSNKTGWITFEQFKQFMKGDTRTFKNALITYELRQAFDEVDTNHDGLISQQEARQGITLAGECIPGPCFIKLVQLFDDDGDGQMSFSEFLNHISEIIHK